MTTWKFTDATNRVAFRALDDGRMESCLAEVLPPDMVIEPADPVPNPRIAEIYAALSALDMKSIRPTREGDLVRLADLELQAQMLRDELKGLTP